MGIFCPRTAPLLADPPPKQPLSAPEPEIGSHNDNPSAFASQHNFAHDSLRIGHACHLGGARRGSGAAGAGPDRRPEEGQGQGQEGASAQGRASGSTTATAQGPAAATQGGPTCAKGAAGATTAAATPAQGSAPTEQSHSTAPASEKAGCTDLQSARHGEARLALQGRKLAKGRGAATRPGPGAPPTRRARARADRNGQP